MKRPIEHRVYTHDYNARTQLLESHVSMFEYGNMPEDINKMYLEYYLQCESMVCWTDKFKEGKLLAVECTLAGDLDPYGLGRDVVAVTRNGQSLNLRRDVDCIVGFNNKTMRPCADIFTDAQTLGEIQTSIDFLIFWTRLSPLVRTSDDKTREKVVEAFRNMKKGIPVTLASKNVLAEFGIPDEITVTDITQPDFADKIQYTARLYDDVLRWHYTRYGHATNGSPKMAQQSVEEVDATLSQSMILPLSMLNARREMLNKVNAMFGTNITVELSGAWRAEVTAFESESGEASIDGSSDDPEKDPEDVKAPDDDKAPEDDKEDDKDNDKTKDESN